MTHPTNPTTSEKKFPVAPTIPTITTTPTPASMPADMKRPWSSKNLKESTIPTPATMPHHLFFEGGLGDRPARSVLINSERYVDGFLYQRIHEQLLMRIPDLPIAKPLAVKDLCSHEFWSSLGNGEKRIAGACVADMVKKGMVKLTRLQWGSASNMYCRT